MEMVNVNSESNDNGGRQMIEKRRSLPCTITEGHRDFTRESRRVSRTSRSEAEEERSLLVREESIRLTKSSSGRRVTASLSMSEAGM